MQEPVISVGIISSKKIKFLLDGDFRLGKSDKTVSGVFTAELKENKIFLTSSSIKESFADEIIFTPSDTVNETFTLQEVVIGVDFHWERKEKQSFKGELKLIIFENKLLAINLVKIENYLSSVISSEMSAKCSVELLKAHAVISRAWLLAQIELSKDYSESKEEYKTEIKTEDELIKWWDREEHKLFDVCADDHCQRYQGISKIFNENARIAVSETRGLVLTCEGKICDTRYYKACGGITEGFENVWQDKKYPYLLPVIDYKFAPDNYNVNFSQEANAVKWIKESPHAYCNTSDKKILAQILPDFDQETQDFYRWKVEYTQEEISKLIFERSGIDFGAIIDLIPMKRGASARIYKMKIVGSKKTLIIGKELLIRKILSKSHLYSSAIVIEKENVVDGVPMNFVIYGAGWGHGSGLCQIGAAVMSEKGFRFDEILSHYYKNSKLQKIY